MTIEFYRIWGTKIRVVSNYSTGHTIGLIGLTSELLSHKVIFEGFDFFTNETCNGLISLEKYKPVSNLWVYLSFFNDNVDIYEFSDYKHAKHFAKAHFFVTFDTDD